MVRCYLQEITALCLLFSGANRGLLRKHQIRLPSFSKFDYMDRLDTFRFSLCKRTSLAGNNATQNRKLSCGQGVLAILET